MMRSFKKLTAFVLAAAMTVGMTAVDTLAASRKKITSISLSVTASINIGDEMGMGEVEVTSGSGNYTVGEYEFTNPGFTWSDDDIPELEIYLYAEDNYYFNVDKDKIKLKGAGATYVSKKTEDSSETLILTIQLSPLSESVSAIADLTLGDDGWARWSPSPGAGSYEVYLYRDGKAVGSARTTATNSYYLGSLMTRSASYSVKVRGVNSINSENKSGWSTSGSCFINEEQAAVLKNSKSQETGWIQDANGWWYKNADGSYPISCWQQIGDKWYYFLDTGYMATGWVETDGKRYYCNPDGDMMVNGLTPDGYTVGEDGAVIQ